MHLYLNMKLTKKTKANTSNRQTVEWRYFHFLLVMYIVSLTTNTITPEGECQNVPFVSVDYLLVVVNGWSWPGPASPANWDSVRGWNLNHFPLAAAESPVRPNKKTQRCLSR